MPIEIALRDFTSETSDMEFLTNTPQPVSLGIDDALRLSYFGTAKTDFLRVIARDAAGTVVFTDFISLTSVATRSLLSVGVGTRNLAAATFVSGGTFTPASYASYEVDLYDGTGVGAAATSQKFIINIDADDCGTAYRFHFMNSLGGLDSITFYSEEEQSIDVQSELARSPETIPFTRQESGDARFNIEASQTYSLVTQDLTNEQLTWLSEMIYSPFVCLEVLTPSAYEYVPVIIDTDRSFPMRSTEQIEQQYILTFRLSKDINTML